MKIFWERIKVLCKSNGITQQQLSEKLGYGARNLEIKIARNSVPTMLELKGFSEIFDVPFNYLIDGKPFSKREKFFLPILNQKESKDIESNPISYLEVPEKLREYGDNLVALNIDGDNMQPTLNRGDMVICDTCGYDGEGLYAISSDTEASVKRVYKDSGKTVIKSDNQLYPTKELSAESESQPTIIGRVRYILKYCN